MFIVKRLYRWKTKTGQNSERETRKPIGSGRMERAGGLIIAKRQKEKAMVQRLAVLVGKRVKCTGCFNRNLQKPYNGKFTLTNILISIKIYQKHKLKTDICTPYQNPTLSRRVLFFEFDKSTHNENFKFFLF